MSYWYDYEVEKQRRKDEMKAAQNHHNARHVLSTRAPVLKAHQRLIAAFGSFLVAVGCRLRDRYAALANGATRMPPEVLATPSGNPTGGCA